MNELLFGKSLSAYEFGRSWKHQIFIFPTFQNTWAWAINLRATNKTYPFQTLNLVIVRRTAQNPIRQPVEAARSLNICSVLYKWSAVQVVVATTLNASSSSIFTKSMSQLPTPKVYFCSILVNSVATQYPFKFLFKNWPELGSVAFK